MLLAGVRSRESRKAATDACETLAADPPGGGSSPVGGTGVVSGSGTVVDDVVVVESGTVDEVLVDVGTVVMTVAGVLVELELVEGPGTVVTVNEVGGVDVGVDVVGT